MAIRARRFSGRAIVAITAVFVSLALFANAAQAFEWEVGGDLLAAKGVSSEATAGAGGAFILSTNVLGSPIEISCASSTSTGSIVTGGRRSTEVTLSSCSGEEKWHPCTTSIAPLKASSELIEVGGTLYERYKPSGAATSFGTIKLGNCPAAGSYPLKGEFGGAVPQSEASVERSVSFSPTVNSTIGAVLKFGSEPVAMTGALNEHLSGSFSGQTWRGIRSEVGPFNWQVSGKPFVPGQLESLRFTGGPIDATWKLSGSTLQFTCSGLAGKDALLKYGGVTEEKLAFSGCEMIASAGCTIASSFETLPVRSEPITEVDGYDYFRFNAGTATEPMAYVQVSGCSIAYLYPIYGTFGAKGGVHGSSQQTQPLELSAAANTLTGSQLRIGGSGALGLSGSVVLEVAGGSLWGSI